MRVTEDDDRVYEAAKGKPCPECGEKEAGYEEFGPFRVLCLACGALLKRDEVLAAQARGES